MSNEIEFDDEALVGLDDLIAIGERLVEMADRVRKLNPAAPGVAAKWILEIDDLKFEVAVTAVTQ